MNKQIRSKRLNLVLVYVCLDALLIAICAFCGAKFVLNSQVAMICASLILFASFYGYKKQVIKKSEILRNSDDFSLYQSNQIYAEFDEPNLDSESNLENSHQNSSNLEPNLTEQNINSSNLAQNSSNLTNTTADDKKQNDKINFSSFEIFTAFRPFRMLSYLFLIASFFVLKNNDLFEPFSFLAGLAIMPIGVFVAGVLNAKQI